MLLILLGIILSVFFVFWWLIPTLSGLPWRPTSNQRIRKALEIAQVKPGETVFDLGSGDGRVVVMAAADFSATAVGIEISPFHCLVSLIFARVEGVSEKIRIYLGDFYKVDISSADVVFAYMTSAQVGRLRPIFEKQLKPGARVVTISFDMGIWEPQEVNREELIFLYRMPPISGSYETFLSK